jgi:hypothetical protein
MTTAHRMPDKADNCFRRSKYIAELKRVSP